VKSRRGGNEIKLAVSTTVLANGRRWGCILITRCVHSKETGGKQHVGGKTYRK
jgi:hypothetical protein